ncbi:MAG: hypothetical protein JJ971_09285 [Balneolaceae bacterium]|nr:hypothetical protein [Balneolaceae bacterium]MBO6546563.1 hypothetical protein [Balneolaceae bacterium]MBO6648922.1 hypothetical protein [Balneolaceae bacterium]
MYRLLLLFPILSISCVVPAPISQVTPSEETQFFWTNGREVLTQFKDSISVELSYYDKQEELFIYDVTITNMKDRAITVDPTQFYYLPVSEKGDTLQTVTAINPENKILEQQIKISKLDAQRKRELNQLLIFGSLELIDDITNNSEPDEYPNSVDIYNYEVAEIDYQSLNTFEQKAYWENQSLRKTTLFAEYYTSGQIYLRYKKDITKIGLFFTFEDTVFEFWFNHSLITHREF